jgi:hypothetical protein
LTALFISPCRSSRAILARDGATAFPHPKTGQVFKMKQRVFVETDLSGFVARLLRCIMAGVSNPFTKSISGSVQSDALRAFVQRWDALEALVVRAFRARAATPADEAEYSELRAWLASHYAPWQPALEPLWKQAKRGGKLCEDDPFAFLFAPETASAFAGSWAHMQALPAARESLNRLLLDHVPSHPSHR